MKRFSGLLLLLYFGLSSIMAQIELAPSVVSTGGGYYEGSEMILSWTIGELAVTTLSGSDMILTQGFQQPDVEAVGIHPDEGLDWEITAYPNPVKDDLYIRFDVPESGTYRMEIQDVTGRLFSQQELEINPGDIRKLELGSYISGIYFLKILSPGQDQQRVTPIRKL